MNETRIRRTAEMIKEAVSDIIATKVKDPRIGFVTVTGVELSRDLSHCKVFVSILGNEDQQQQTLAVLTSAAGFIRSELGSKIRIRHVPELKIVYDQALNHSIHINKLIAQLKRGDNDGGNAQ